MTFLTLLVAQQRMKHSKSQKFVVEESVWI